MFPVFLVFCVYNVVAVRVIIVMYTGACFASRPFNLMRSRAQVPARRMKYVTVERFRRRKIVLAQTFPFVATLVQRRICSITIERSLFCECKEPPDFPRNLHVIDKGSRYINVSWTTSQDGNSPITQYIIEYKTDTGNLIDLNSQLLRNSVGRWENLLSHTRPITQ